ncbi:hypothetical protein Vretifemale_506 [Volvox reticuliferus]|uniref:EGF-like domain-containing protein n=1 Tax=Volvox reticuliferus TaxID=1737510 RepID=A0A8J4FFA6_9CHLO|nr:hypothetical protein Vretifemale_506 [Volvox reticuliferus]
MAADKMFWRLLCLVVGLCIVWRLCEPVAPAIDRHGVSSHNLVEHDLAFNRLDGGFVRKLLQDEDEEHFDERLLRELVDKINRSSLNPMPETAEERCFLTRGSWCTQYLTQAAEPRLLPTYFDKPCPRNCSGVGVCNHEYGLCFCPAGYGGEDCSQPRKRPCHHMGTGKRDAGWHNLTAWSHTRCAGVCDDDVAMCYCPPGTKYGRIEAPPGAALGTPPLQQGRPLFMCTPGTDEAGRKVEWGGTPYQDIFGPEGWCNAEKPAFKCPCRLDGLGGSTCSEIREQVCVNQCSGHGQCNQGFCKCYEGWYGMDCGLRRAGKVDEEGDEMLAKPWISDVMTHVVATEDPPMTPERRRPYIYVYDIKPDFSTDIMQYRIEGSHCVYRSFEKANKSVWVGYNAYSVEPVLHELFLTSEHRTLNPEEADYFYVPVSVGCLFDVYGWNEIPRWPRNILGTRSHGAAMLQREAMRWLNATFPWFARRGGRDHIWLNPHDEGACYVWKDIWPGVMLSHWGRTDFPHASNTAYSQDNYSLPLHHPLHPGDWLEHTSKAHPCFDPEKDLVIPAFKQPSHYRKSPYMGMVGPVTRTIFAFFQGDLRMEPGRDPACRYSRCIRQRMYNLSKDQLWKEKYDIWYGDRKDMDSNFDYSEMLSRSTFCFVLPGDGWSPRLEDSVLHGCIPVIIMDQVQVAFENIMDMDQFSVRIGEGELDRIVEILQAISPEQIQTMQDNINKVWHRFRYLGIRMATLEVRQRLQQYRENHDEDAPKNPGSEHMVSRQDDAFDTIIQWLHYRMPFVHKATKQ